MDRLTIKFIVPDVKIKIRFESVVLNDHEKSITIYVNKKYYKKLKKTIIEKI